MRNRFLHAHALLAACAAACGDDPGTVDITLGQERVCTAEDLRRGCHLGPCSLEGAAPDGTLVHLRRVPLTSELRGDALEPELCELVDPPPTALTVSIKPARAPNEQTTLFRHDAPNRDVVMPSAIGGDHVFASTVVKGLFGATTKPSAIALEGVARFRALSSDTVAALIRNITGQTLESVFFDGTRLYLGSGTRLLIYNRFPDDATTKPDVVLGQPNLDSEVVGISSSTWNLPVSAIWSDGTRLVVGNRNRALVYRQIPTQNYAPADVVLGQPDFSTNTANFGGISASTLSFVSDIQSDGARLYVSDLLNNRVLVWETFPTRNGEPATQVIGQPSFTTNTANIGATPIAQAWATAPTPSGLFVASRNAGSFFLPPIGASNPAPLFSVIARGNAGANATTLTLPNSLALSQNGGLLIGDAAGNRIGAFYSTPTAQATRLDFVLGQTDLERSSWHPASPSVVVPSSRVCASGGKVFVTDTSRVLVYDRAPLYAFDPADRTLAQASAYTNEVGADYARIAGNTVAGPADVSVSGNTIAIADRANNRVLLARIDDPNATPVVVGQPDASAFLPNRGAPAPRSDGLNGPASELLDGTRLFVADTGNHRVLVWNQVPTSAGAPADVVIGQDDFTHGRPNHGNGDADSNGRVDTDGRGFFEPMDLETDGTRLFVVDRANHRVLAWDAIPTSNGSSATRAIGQASLNDNGANRGNGPLTFVGEGLNLPMAIVRDGTSLWIADTDNNRIVRWDNAGTAPLATTFIGQTSGAQISNPNYFVGGANSGLQIAVAPTLDTFVRPRGLTLSGRTLIVAEQAAHRLHLVNADTSATIAILGQPSDTGNVANGRGLDAASTNAPWGLASNGARVFLADEGNHRVVGFDAASLAATSRAQWLFGQALYEQNGFNRSSAPSAAGGRKPRSIASTTGTLFVAETDANRVVVLDSAAINPSTPTRVFGQPDVDLRLSNSGGAPSASSLRSPRGVSVYTTRVAIADSGNNRVLLFDTAREGNAATFVLGQTDFVTVTPNRGTTASSASLNAPEGVYFDGTRLFVADTANHRVLVWNQWPTANGQSADAVLGQATASEVLANRNVGAANESTLNLPAGIVADGETLWIADTGNNRVVRYASLTTGATADRVLGQPSANDRVPASSAQDRTRLAGPVTVASDGVSLFVADRDGGRVVVFAIGDASFTPAALAIDSVNGARFGNASGLVVERGPLFTTRVFVADPIGEAITVVGPLSRLLGPRLDH